MVRDLTASLEMPLFDEQEFVDQKICQQWRDIHGGNFL